MIDESEQEGTIVEYTLLGNFIKVTAIDTRSGREVSLIGSPRAPRRQLADLAARKLRYVMNRDNG